jgi:hypothetical protein
LPQEQPFGLLTPPFLVGEGGFVFDGAVDVLDDEEVGFEKKTKTARSKKQEARSQPRSLEPTTSSAIRSDTLACYQFDHQSHFIRKNRRRFPNPTGFFINPSGFFLAGGLISAETML